MKRILVVSGGVIAVILTASLLRQGLTRDASSVLVGSSRRAEWVEPLPPKIVGPGESFLPVAHVRDRVVTLKEIADILGQSVESLRVVGPDGQERIRSESVVYRGLQRLAIVEEARASGLHETEEFRLRKSADRRAQLCSYDAELCSFLCRIAPEFAAPRVTVTDEEIRAYRRDNARRFRHMDQLKADKRAKALVERAKRQQAQIEWQLSVLERLGTLVVINGERVTPALMRAAFSDFADDPDVLDAATEAKLTEIRQLLARRSGPRAELRIDDQLVPPEMTGDLASLGPGAFGQLVWHRVLAGIARARNLHRDPRFQATQPGDAFNDEVFLEALILEHMQLEIEGITYAHAEPTNDEIHAYIAQNPSLAGKFDDRAVLRTTVWSVLRNQKLVVMRREYARDMMKKHRIRSRVAES